MNYSIIVAIFLLTTLGAGCVSQTSTTPPSETPSAPVSIPGASRNVLDLSNKNLTQVSQDVFKKTNLTELNLSHNRLTGAIPAEIRMLSQLEALDLSDNMMTGLPAEVGQLSHLKVLDLSNNQLTGLPMELGNLSNLQTLDLRGNAYSVQDLDQIRQKLLQTNILVD